MAEYTVITHQDRLDYAAAMRSHCSHGPRPDYYTAGDLDNLACPHAVPVVNDKHQMVNLLHARLGMQERIDAEWKP